MNTLLAEKLLCSILNWSEEEVRVERPSLQAISDFKYDEYQQFSPGMRFIESLARWLKQFDEPSERKVAYQFVKDQLIFISNDQISHLVNLAYSVKIKPLLVIKTAQGNSDSRYHIKKICSSKLFVINRRRTLYLGLSDGAKIDLFRRSSGISNEQVYPTYQISEEKADDFRDELIKDTGNKNFNTLFLIDDFTASGKSYWRIEEGKGKILKLFQSIFEQSTEDKNYVSKILDKETLSVHIVFYIATSAAKDYIHKSIENWKKEQGHKFEHTIEVIQIIDDSVKQEILDNKDFLSLAEKYFDNSIIDKHFRKGKSDLPFLGFNECGLPLVLNHNTPNNSLPILWFPDDKEYTGLFPRVTRHKE